MVICLERSADLHMAQLMLLPLTVSCFSKIQIGFTFLVLAHPGSPGQRATKRVYTCCLTNYIKICWTDRCRIFRVCRKWRCCHCSYLTGRTKQVLRSGRLSEVLHLLRFVPWGSVLGPILFISYVAAVFDIITSCECEGHFYADDTLSVVCILMTSADSGTQNRSVWLHVLHTSTAMDDDEQIKTERRQDSVNVAWNPAAARQAHRLSTPFDYVSRRVRVYRREGSRRGSGQPAVHGVTSHCSLPVVLLSVAVTHNRRSTIPRSSLHPLPAALLQRSTHWDSQGLDETRLFRMPQLVWCLGLIAVTMPCHYCATFIGCQWDCKLSSKLLSSFGSVSMALLQSTCKSMHSSGPGQHSWSFQTTVCVSWLHPAIKSANICCTAELCLQWTGSVEQSDSNTATYCQTVACHYTHLCGD